MSTLPIESHPVESKIAALPPLVCTVCNSAEDLMMESIQLVTPTAIGYISIEYSCAACETFYAHTASIQQAAQLLPADAMVQGVLRFGDLHIHCGEPMEEISGEVSSSDKPASVVAGTVKGESSSIRGLKCRCGYRIGLGVHG